MKLSSTFWLLNGSILFNLIFPYSTQAQIIPDTTLPENSVVTTQDKTIQIDGGTRAGDNLFHSFEHFSVRTGNTAFFNNAGDVQNILSRVTGSSRSEINGTIQANGTANLFLINPNGIIFGKNASLNASGSFLASTASSIIFADGSEFSTTNTQSKPLLTIKIPLGLKLRDLPGSIVNQSRATGVGLQVLPGKTLALVGADVSLEGGILTAKGGRIELGSVAGNSLVSLNPTEKGWALGYEGIQNFQDIGLSKLANINTSGERGGEIQLQGKRVILTGDSRIVSTNSGAEVGGNLLVSASESLEMSGDATTINTASKGTGAAGNLTIATRKLIIRDGAYVETPTRAKGKAGNLTVKATESVELVGKTSDGIPSGLFTEVTRGATGDGGKITIETGRLIVKDGAQISTSTFGSGSAGDLIVKASESVELLNEGPSGLFARVGNRRIRNVTGDGGTISIETRRLIVKDGAQVSTSTFGIGSAGDLIVKALDSVELEGTTADSLSASGLSTKVEPGATGDAGNLSIETGWLLARKGAQISTAARSRGQGGTLSIHASDSVLLSGISPKADARSSSGVFVSAEQGATRNAGELIINTGQLTVEKGAKISADNFGTGQGSNVTLNVNQLTIQDGGLVGAGSLLGEGAVNNQRGAGGTLTVNATESVEVIDTGTIGSTPVKSSLFTKAEGTGNAGDLNIFTKNLNVRDGGEINVSATDAGEAGNLKVEANSIRLNQGTITAATVSGEGGNIDLQVQDVLLMQDNSLISAQAGGDANGGNIHIDAEFVIASPDQNNDIIASAKRGAGGNINITTRAIFGLEERSWFPPNNTNDIDASSEFGLDGNVSINAPEVDPNRGLVELPTQPVNVEVAQGCQAGSKQASLEFFNTGRGGIAPNPYEPLSSSNLWEDVPPSTNASAATLPDKIVEAQGWLIDEKGEVILVAEMPTIQSQSRCRLR